MILTSQNSLLPPAASPIGPLMSVLFRNARGHLATKTARDAARLQNAETVRSQDEADRQAADERTAQLRAMRLARDKATS
jgi:hypothetical protein